jgi:hypothetical protein
MSQISAALLALAAVVALSACGKKKEDEAASAPAAVAKLSITCGGVACIGTEGK